MTIDEALDELENNPKLGAAAHEGRPAFAVDRRGDVAWANPIARRLVGAGGLEAAARRTLARMAATGAGGLVRLRLGAIGRLTPTAMQARPFGGLLVLEELAAAERPGLRGPAADDRGLLLAPQRDVASEEGAGSDPLAEAPQFSEAASCALDGDAPPDPRRALAPPSGSDEPAAAETVVPEATPRPADPDAPFRFTFEIDQDLRFNHLSAELGRVVGPSAAAALGKPWSEVATALDLDPAGAVANALEQRGGWGELRIVWPAADGRPIPLALSALPMFDRGRSFVGFRGLGRSVAGPETHAAPTNGSAKDAGSERAQRIGEALAPPIAARLDLAAAEREIEQAPEAAGDGGEAARDAAALLESPSPSRPFRDNVVPLHDAAARAPALSSTEESAFDEIARRLKSIGGADTATQIPDTAEIVAPTHPESDWTIDDLEGHAPVASRAEDLLRLIDRLPVGALVLRAGAVEHANRCALDMLGHRDLADLKARPAGSLFAEPPPRDDAAPSTLKLIADDGVEVGVEARLSTIAWGGGPATLVSLRRAEGAVAAAHAALKREEELSATLDVAVDGVMTLDGAGRILSVNRGAEALFGFHGRDVVGSLFTLSLAPESRRAAFDCLDELKAGSGAAPEGREVLGLARHGGSIPLYLTIGRLGAPDGNRYCAVLRDVSQWRRAEDELVVAKRQAERANAQKSDFLAKVSHEIRTPLNAMIGFAEVMMEERFGPVGSPRYKDYLKDIQTSGAHLIGLVDDLLDLTRIETGKMKFDFTPVDLNEIVQQAAALLQPQATRGRVIIRTSLARGLPPVLADRRSIRQIMTNLASNAVRFSRPGGQVIVATAMTDVGQAVIRVRDAGLGMTRQELARAMEPFRPLAIADNDTGAGLGLPLTKALAEANEAALALKSEVGQGTLAEVTFPASRVLAS